MRELIILSTGRAGTTYFCDALAQFAHLFVGYEVFNPTACFGAAPLLAHLSDITGTTFTAEDDPALVAHMRQNPAQAADHLHTAAARAGNQALAWKVFPHQLRTDLLAPLLTRPNAHYLFITRNRLDVFASTLKAKALHSFKGTPTTALKPDFHLPDFQSWACERDRLMQTALQACPPERRQILTYEAFINTDFATLLTRQRALLKSLNLPHEHPNPGTSNLARQDTTPTSTAKFANPHAVAKALNTATLTTYAHTPFLTP